MSPQEAIERVCKPIPEQLSEIAKIFPKDAFRLKRVRNLSKATYVLILKIGEDIAGVLFIRDMAHIHNVTWVVDERYRRRHVAYRLVRQAQKDYGYITAVCRNEASVNLAKKTGFRMFPFGFAIWVRRRDKR